MKRNQTHLKGNMLHEFWVLVIAHTATPSVHRLDWIGFVFFCSVPMSPMEELETRKRNRMPMLSCSCCAQEASAIRMRAVSDSAPWRFQNVRTSDQIRTAPEILSSTRPDLSVSLITHLRGDRSSKQLEPIGLRVRDQNQLA